MSLCAILQCMAVEHSKADMIQVSIVTEQSDDIHECKTTDTYMFVVCLIIMRKKDAHVYRQNLDHSRFTACLITTHLPTIVNIFRGFFVNYNHLLSGRYPLS